MPERLKYINYAIVFQEVPDEISLAINISGCRYRCRGCHSKHLWEYKGNYLLEDLEDIINAHEFITCVCFMGGDQNMEELEEALHICKKHDLKTCLYTGNENIKNFTKIFPWLDWIKIGRYDDTKLSDNHIEYGIKLASMNQHIYPIHSFILTNDN